MLQQFNVDTKTIHMNYVGMIKDIMPLDYELANTLIILLRCEWIKCTYNQGSNTYKEDDAKLLVVNSSTHQACLSITIHISFPNYTFFFLDGKQLG